MWPKLFISVAAYLGSLAIVYAKSPPVKVQLRAPWQKLQLSNGGSPLLLELLEAASSQEPSSFFPLVSQLVEHHTASQLSSASDQWLAESVQALIKASDLFGLSVNRSTQSIETWKVSLALHDTSPRVQAFTQLYNTLQLDRIWESRSSNHSCVSWVHWNGTTLCSAEELAQAISSLPTPARRVSGDTVRILPFDHVLSSTAATKTTETTFWLYGDIFSSNFAELHSLLQQHTVPSSPEPGKGITYVLRWRPSSKSDTPRQGPTESTFLGGYGAILDLKKVDYLVIDDRKLKDDSQIGDVGDTTSTELQDAENTRLAAINFQWLQDQIMLSGSSQNATSLTDNERSDLGWKAVELIMASSDPLRALQELSQNFPSHAISLARSNKFKGGEASDLVEAVLSMGEMRIEPGASEIWFNGMTIPHSEVEPLKLLQMIKKERHIIEPLTSSQAGLNVTEALDLISSSLVGRAYAAHSQGQTPSAIFDASDRIERQALKENDIDTHDVGAITWFNDLENDEKTSNWSKDLLDLLRPMWPGNFPRLSINLFNVVLVLDLSKRESCRFLAETVGPSLGRIGLHWGLVPGGLEAGKGSDSAKMARLFWFLIDKASTQVAFDVLRRAATSPGGTDTKLDIKNVIKETKFALKHLEEGEILGARLGDVVAGRWQDNMLQETMVRAYIERLRATEAESRTGHVFINGYHQPFHPQIIRLLHQAVQEQIQTLAPHIYYRQITSDTPGLDTFFYDSIGALSFRSALVPGSAAVSNATSSDTKTIVHSYVDLFSALSDRLIPTSDTDTLFSFFYPRQRENGRTNSTIWIFADFDCQEGVALLQKAFQALNHQDASFRLGFLHLPSTSLNNCKHAGDDIPLSVLLYQLLRQGSVEQITPVQVLGLLDHYMLPDAPLSSKESRSEPRSISNEAVQKIFAVGEDRTDGASANPWTWPATAEAKRFWSVIAKVVTSRLRLPEKTGYTAILVDGHLISGFEVSHINSHDITAVVQYEAAQKVPGVLQALELIGKDIDNMQNKVRQDLIFACISVLNSVYNVEEAGQSVFFSKSTHRTGVMEQMGTADHTFEVGDRNTANIRLSVMVNPISEAAQKWSSILVMLSKLQGVYLRVILNPPVVVTDMPLQRYYRYSAPTELSFDQSGKETVHELHFSNMPEDAVLTLGLDVPAAWLTMPMEAIYDLDNIRLADVPSASRSKGVKAVYELKHILVEGHARQLAAADAPSSVPRGVQLLLETPDGTTSLDTIVMANLAYFQFKAQPGLWKLRLRPGRSEQLYEMISVGNNGWDSPSVDLTGDDITLDTLAGLTIYPRLRKRPGKEKEELLEELDAQGRPVKKKRKAGQHVSPAAYASHLISSAKDTVVSLAHKTVDAVGTKGSVKSAHTDINIFTVASGHLYERMTYIMILSVLKHTSSSVKFWFIENFLSPSFKEFIPHLAKEYGFEYELVTYAWPHWLRSQKEKQRTIWGYKILFLDTLFPLDLTKVIFVDADQVVRTDMKELVDLDLEGKVYGYPPMGDDSEDMDGFRFWKQGYWKEYLRGRPYHISALYVVDLQRFRLFAAGDRLRGQYQALSADANSLSNLDQDLPNNMQASLPIHTLPKEWLWCETWCSHAWLPDAKTIDLCSNPKTKEPKLARARRQIPEWTTYDNEVAALAHRLVEHNEVGASVVDPSRVELVPPHSASLHPILHSNSHDEL